MVRRVTVILALTIVVVAIAMVIIGAQSAEGFSDTLSVWGFILGVVGLLLAVVFEWSGSKSGVSEPSAKMTPEDATASCPSCGAIVQFGATCECGYSARYTLEVTSGLARAMNQTKMHRHWIRRLF